MAARSTRTHAHGASRQVPDDLAPDQTDDRRGGARGTRIQGIEQHPGPR